MAAKRRCPVCDVQVNFENLAGHMAHVHPREEATLPLEAKGRREAARRRSVPMSRAQRRAILYGTVGVIVIVLAIVLGPYLLPTAGGTIHLEPTSYDFGDIAQAPVSTTFRLHNLGTSNLLLKGVSTSCMCTSARVSYGGTTSPAFGYHDNPAGWSLSLPPGTEASLVVAYDPTVHPELGHYVREVYILSSDPEHREATVEIHATEV